MNRIAMIASAVRSLMRNKLRSALTVLGITIGIAAVICVVAIGKAGQSRVEQQLNTHEPDIAQFTKRMIVFKDGRIRKDESMAERFQASAVLQTLPPWKTDQARAEAPGNRRRSRGLEPGFQPHAEPVG